MENKLKELKKFYEITRVISSQKYSIPIIHFIKHQDGKLIYNNLDCLVEYKLDEPIFKEDCLISIEKLLFVLKSPKSFKLESIIGKEQYKVEAYPIVTHEEGEFYKIDNLSKIMKYAVSFVSSDETRYYLNGVYFDKNVLVATDGHVLIKNKTKCNFNNSFILPTETCRIISNLKDLEFRLDSTKETNKKAIFKNDKIKIISKVINGEYPNYDKVVNISIKGKLKMSLKVEDYNFLSGRQHINFDDNIISYNAHEYQLNTGHKMQGAFYGEYLKKILSVARQHKLDKIEFSQGCAKNGNPAPLFTKIGDNTLLLMPTIKK